VGNATGSDTTACGSSQIEAGCETWPSLIPSPITVNIFESLQLCVLFQGESALQRVAIDPTTNCTSGYQLCGTGANAFCFPTTSDCPITDFYITTQDLDLNSAGADQKINLSTSNFLYIRRGGALNFSVTIRSPMSLPVTGLPLTTIDWQLSDPCTLSGCGYSRQPVIAEEERVYEIANPGYGYIVQPQCEGGCLAPDISNSVSKSGRDIRFLRSYSANTFTLYSALPVPPQFNPNSTYDYYLSSRSEIEWSNDCPKTRQDVIDKQNIVETVTHAQLALLLFSIISFLIISLALPIIIWRTPEFESQNKWTIRIIKVASKLATLICTIITIVFAYASLSFWDAVNNTKAVEPCSDPLTAETFQTLGNIFLSLSYKNAISTASMGLAGVLEFCEVCIERL